MPLPIDATLLAGLLLIVAAVLGAVLLARRRARGPVPSDEEVTAASIRRVGLGLIAGFVAVSLGLVYWQVLRAAELTERPDNIRRIRLLRRNRRGSILDRKGRPLVTSEVADDGFVKRVYNYPMLSPVTGYWSLRYGQTGVEGAFDQYLTGQYAANPLDPLRRKLFHEAPVGADVRLTIDLDIQQAAVDALAGNAGAVVVMDIQTGGILAMASVPFFNPNQLVLDPTGDNETEARLVQQYWTGLVENPNRPLVNRVTQGLYSPGSIFKTVTLVAALDRGLANVNTTYRYDMRPPNATHEGVWHANDWTDCMNHEQSAFDLAQGFAYSCNVLFADLGVEMGYETYSQYARRFGMGSPIPLDIDTAASLLTTTDDYFTGQEATYAVASTAFGQGQLLVTPLQAAMLAVAPGNRGALPRPRLVDAVIAPDGSVVREYRPEQWRTVMSPDVAARTLQCMVVSVQQGWAKVIELPNVAVAGKTGTAEVVNDEAKNPHAWFIACAPADNPRYAVAVVREFAGGGATFAGPIVKAVLQAALRFGGE